MKKILSEIASGVQKTLDMFTNVLRKVKERVSSKITYRGDLRHLFLFYPFDEILDAWERENHPKNKGSSNVSDLSIYQ
jgi:hypothetical protein